MAGLEMMRRTLCFISTAPYRQLVVHRSDRADARDRGLATTSCHGRARDARSSSASLVTTAGRAGRPRSTVWQTYLCARRRSRRDDGEQHAAPDRGAVQSLDRTHHRVRERDPMSILKSPNPRGRARTASWRQDQEPITTPRAAQAGAAVDHRWWLRGLVDHRLRCSARDRSLGVRGGTVGLRRALAGDRGRTRRGNLRFDVGIWVARASRDHGRTSMTTTDAHARSNWSPTQSATTNPHRRERMPGWCGFPGSPTAVAPFARAGPGSCSPTATSTPRLDVRLDTLARYGIAVHRVLGEHPAVHPAKPPSRLRLTERRPERRTAERRPDARVLSVVAPSSPAGACRVPGRVDSRDAGLSALCRRGGPRYIAAVPLVVTACVARSG